MEYKDYYKILGVDKNATDKEIKSAYRKLAKKYHPDLHPDDTKAHDKFKEVNEAYEVLSDKEKRQKYDTFGSGYDFQGGANFDPSQFGYTYTSSGNASDFSDFFDMVFGSRGSGSGFSGGFNVGDIFSDLGGRKSARSKKNRQKFNSELTISLREAYQGTTKHISLNYGGQDIDVDVKIPAGITRGKKIKVRGEKYNIPGDILFKIEIQDDKKRTLDGINIIQQEDIYPWEALFGSQKTVDTLAGKVKVNIPKNFQGGSKMRLAKRGFKDLKNKKGDLYLVFNIVNPKNLTEEQRQWYKKLEESRRG